MAWENYRMTFDLHTHTTYSHGWPRPHGKGTVEENVRAAIAKGLQGIAISDHGPGHVFYGIRPEKIMAQRQDIRSAQSAHPEIRVYMSVEANLTWGKKNRLDVDAETAKKFDFLIAGYHYGVPLCGSVPNWIGSHLHLGEKLMRTKNTDLYVSALYENKIKVLTHPGDKGLVDIEEVAKACAANHTLMEINNSHTHLTVREIRAAMKEDVYFIISSDAHTPDRVGTFEKALERAQKAGLDFSRIVNIRKIKGDDDDRE